MSIGAPIGAARNFWLDACRSLAILAVVLSHGRHFLTPALEGASVLRLGGFLGVELFFALSGFLIGRILWRTFTAANFTWLPTFLVRRWLRTLPNYYLFLAINAALIAAAVVPGRLGELGPFLIFSQNLAWPHPPVFGEAWSLSVEEIFYLTFPLELLLLGRIVRNKSVVFWLAASLLVLFSFVARWAAVALADASWDEGVRKVVILRLDSLMLGVLASWLVHEAALFRQVRPALLLWLAGGTLLVVAATYFAAGSALDSGTWSRVLLFPVTSVGCTLLVLAGLSWRGPGFLVRPAEICARWSYALYLSHMPVFHCLHAVLGDAAPGAGTAVLRLTLFLGASVALAAAVERWFERPILRWRDRAFP